MPDDEDDYDRPRRRRRRDDDSDDDDDDYRPRRRRERPRSGPGTGLIVGIVVGAMAVLGLCLAAPCLLGLVLPAAQKVRQAAERQKTENLKQLGLATHNQLNADDQFWGPFAPTGKGGVNRGLSHRVGLLPYLPDGGPPEQTPDRAFVGGGAIFKEDGSAVRVGHITDGMSNTILYLHAAESVTWTEPREFPFGPDRPLPSLTVPGFTGGTYVGLADGSVRFLRATTSEATFRALVTRAGGEVVQPDW